MAFKDDLFAQLSKAIESRMACTAIRNFSGYLDTLLHSDAEFQSLLSLLTVNETYFMREPHHYDLLANRLVPELLEKRQAEGRKIQILSAGCSTGEEPYSILISLVHKYGEKILDLVSVVAFDIHPGAIETAKKGIYGEHSFRGINADIKSRYFTPLVNDQYEVLPILKQKARFFTLNLGKKDYPALIQGMDIIFYRNVSIYFQLGTQKNIFNKLANILSDGGYLITSTVETCMHNMGILFLVEMNGLYLYSKRFEVKMDYSKNILRRASPPAPAQKPPAKTKKPAPTAEKAKTPSELFGEALTLAKEKAFEKALSHIDVLLKKDPAFTRAISLKAAILINLKQIAEAEKVCLTLLKFDEWNLESYLLLGIAANIKNNPAEAFKRFKGALYIQPDCWLAHFYLAELFYSLEQPQESHREYGVTLKLLQKNGISNNGLTFFPLSFSVDQLIHLCKHNRDKLKSRLR